MYKICIGTFERVMRFEYIDKRVCEIYKNFWITQIYMVRAN
jgi:hypothetical protein